MSSSLPLAQQNPAHSSTQLQQQKMEMAQHEVKGLGQSKLTDAEKAKKLRETCESFESIFIQKMWTQMRATLPQENPLVGKEEKFWQSMYDTEFSKKMSEGGGIGLADMMYEQLSQNLFNVSKTTANATSGQAFEVTMPPLIPRAPMNTTPTATALTTAASAPSMGSATSSRQGLEGLYENIQTPSTQAASGANTQGGMGNAAQNASSVQQFLNGLQAKQGLQNSARGTQLTGPQLANQAQVVAGSPPPAQGVLPHTPQVVRYTTNIPKNSRQNDAEQHLKDLMAKAATQQQQVHSWQQVPSQQQAELAVQRALQQAQKQSSNTFGATGQTPTTPQGAPMPPTTPFTPVVPQAAPALSSASGTNVDAMQYMVPPVSGTQRRS